MKASIAGPAGRQRTGFGAERASVSKITAARGARCAQGREVTPRYRFCEITRCKWDVRMEGVFSGFGREHDSEFFSLKKSKWKLFILKQFQIYRKAAKKVQYSMCLHPASPDVNFLHNHGAFTKMKKLTSVQY